MYHDLEVYDKQTDELVASYRLHDIGIKTMQRLWKRPPDDPMLGGYKVEPEMVVFLRQYLDADISFEDEEYVYQAGTYRDYPGEIATIESQPQN